MPEVDGDLEAIPAPPRYRCTACGNLTRFDVTTTLRMRSFYHFGLNGTLTIEEAEVLSEHVEVVSCRWCDNVANVVSILSDPGITPVVTE